MIEIKNNYPLIMGIINITPDSFYNKSRHHSSSKINIDNYNYADIIDIGCESSRPGAQPLDENKEFTRLSNFINNNPSLKDKILSIDTYKPNIAKFALKNGFAMINDIKSGSNNGEMIQLAASYNCPIILMHMKGCPKTMQNNPQYDNIIDNILAFFEKKIQIAELYGIRLDNIILDPGIGFGKSVEDNDAIINNLHIFKQFGCKVLIGISRKSFLSVNKDEPKDRLTASIGVSAILMQHGVDIIRTHDMYETYKLKTIISRLNNNQYANNLYN